MTDKPPRQIAGFWRRLFAFVFDMLVLAGVGFALSFVFWKQFAALGAWGPLVGFSVAAVYFGLLNSSLAGGQTVGKRALKIQVLGTDGEFLSLPRSFARYSVLGAPYFLNGARINPEALPPAVTYLLYVTIVGVGLSIVYLYVFNRVTRQSLHDLVVRSVVVNAAFEKPLDIGRVWKPHGAMVSLFLLSSVALSAYMNMLAGHGSFSAMLAIQQQICEEPGVAYCVVSDRWTTFTTVREGTSTSTDLTVELTLSDWSVNDHDLAERTAAKLFESYSGVSKRDRIIISIIRGWDIGIASFSRRQDKSKSPAEWEAQLGTHAI